jgi:hypothetical protein
VTDSIPYAGLPDKSHEHVLARRWHVAGNAAAIVGMTRTGLQHIAPANDPISSYAGYRFPPDVISYAVWLYCRFPLGLHMVKELLAARGIDLTYETVRRWSVYLAWVLPGASGPLLSSEATSGTSRGGGHDQRQEALAVARGGPAWRGA